MQSIRSQLVKGFMRAVVKTNNAITTPGKKQREALDAYVKLNARFGVEKVKTEKICSVRCAWVRYKKVAQDKVIIHLHGGGYTSGTIESHHALAMALSRVSGVSVLLPEYSLAPEKPFPSALNDVVSVYKSIIKQGFNPKNIIISGDSAGGGLALACVLSLKKEKIPLPVAIICLSPWTDLTCSGGTYITKQKADPFLVPSFLKESAKMYCGNHNSNNPSISPLFADLKGFPPMLIHVGSEEILLDDSFQLALKAKKAGVKVTLKVWRGMWHVWHIFGELLPESSQALKHIGRFSKKHLNNTSIGL
jgi:acetyl esterase/lipase